MWFNSIRRIGCADGSRSSVGLIFNTFARHFSRKRAENLRKINPKLSPQEASFVSQDLYGLVKQHGPLTISNAWIKAQEAGVGGLNSKTHMKIMLKWMRGRKMLKLFCNQVGSNKKFLLSTLPDDDRQEDKLKSSSELGERGKPIIRGMKAKKKPLRSKKPKPSVKGKKPSK